MAEPKFFVIGAQKCGTTWFQEMLRQHPGVFLPDVKEVNYFVKPEHNRHSRQDKGWNWYQDLYSAHAGKVTGDVTPDYIYWDYCARDIAARLPDARIIAILRHPVERAYSQYWMSRRNQTHSESFETILETNPHLIGRGKYVGQMRRFFDAFPASNVKVLFYEEFFADPVTNIRTVFEFLGLAPDFAPAGLDKRIGGTVVYRGVMGRIVYRYLSPVISHPLVLPVYRTLRYHTNLRDIFVRLFASRQGYQPIAANTRARLLELFAPENRELEALLGRTVPAEWSR